MFTSFSSQDNFYDVSEHPNVYVRKVLTEKTYKKKGYTAFATEEFSEFWTNRAYFEMSYEQVLGRMERTHTSVSIKNISKSPPELMRKFGHVKNNKGFNKGFKKPSFMRKSF
jgi:hypothetical protein